MLLRVKVKPNANRQQIETAADGSLLVHLRSSPVDGKANAELIQLLAKEFKVARSSIHIKTGVTAKFKLIQIESLH